MAKRSAQAPPEGPAFTAFRKYLLATREEQFAALVENTKRAAAAARRRRKLFDTLAKAAGIDPAAVDALHEKEWQVISEPSGRQNKAAARLAKLQRDSHGLPFRPSIRTVAGSSIRKVILTPRYARGERGRACFIAVQKSQFFVSFNDPLDRSYRSG